MGSGYGDWERVVAFWRVLEMIEPRGIPRATRAREKREPGTDFVEAIELRRGPAALGHGAGHRERHRQGCATWRRHPVRDPWLRLCGCPCHPPERPGFSRVAEVGLALPHDPKAWLGSE